MIVLLIYFLLVLLLIIYYTKRTVYFVTFADSRYLKSLNNICSQAKEISDRQFCFTEQNLNLSDYKEFIKQNKRGYGYWIWKPIAILECLKNMRYCDYLIYADAGCSIIPERKNVLYDKLKDLELNPILGFQSGHIEKKFSKKDTINRLYSENCEITEQMMATVIFMKKTEDSLKFVNEWLNICKESDYHHLNDSPSIDTNYNEFIEHRHDQSIFSLLHKSKSYTYHSYEEFRKGAIIDSRNLT